MNVSTIARILQRMVSHDTLLCCGLDPDYSKIPVALKIRYMHAEDAVFDFLKRVVNVTAAHVCAYKAQKAFFDLMPGGHDVLKSIIEYTHLNHPGIPVLLDCKIGDIDNTMTAYATNVFDHLQADGVVVNPYMGDDVFSQLADYGDKAVVVLVKTSNPNGAIVQDVRLENGMLMWEYILDLMLNRWNGAGNMIPVLSSTVGLDMADIRRILPDQMPILLAGVGAQGGDSNAVRALLNSKGIGPFVNSSRGILYPSHTEDNWLSAIESAAIALKDDLNTQRVGT